MKVYARLVEHHHKRRPQRFGIGPVVNSYGQRTRNGRVVMCGRKDCGYWPGLRLFFQDPNWNDHPMLWLPPGYVYGADKVWRLSTTARRRFRHGLSTTGWRRQPSHRWTKYEGVVEGIGVGPDEALGYAPSLPAWFECPRGVGGCGQKQVLDGGILHVENNPSLWTTTYFSDDDDALRRYDRSGGLPVSCDEEYLLDYLPLYKREAQR